MQVGALVWFFVSCRLLAIALGLTDKNAHSMTTVGPEIGAKTLCCTAVNGELDESALTYKQWTPKQQNYTAIAWRSLQMSIANIVIIQVTSTTRQYTSYNSNHTLNSPVLAPPSRTSTPKVLQGANCKKNGPNLAGSCPNWTIRVVLASLWGLDSWKNFDTDFWPL